MLWSMNSNTVNKCVHHLQKHLKTLHVLGYTKQFYAARSVSESTTTNQSENKETWELYNVQVYF